MVKLIKKPLALVSNKDLLYRYIFIYIYISSIDLYSNELIPPPKKKNRFNFLYILIYISFILNFKLKL